MFGTAEAPTLPGILIVCNGFGSLDVQRRSTSLAAGVIENNAPYAALALEHQAEDTPGVAAAGCFAREVKRAGHQGDVAIDLRDL